MATAPDAPDPELTFHPSLARRIWRIAQPVLWLMGCGAAVAVDRPVLAVATGALALVAGTIAWRQRGESVGITDGVLRHTTGQRTRAIDLRHLVRIDYELMPGRFPIPPRSLWLTGSGGGVRLGHRGTWPPGQWDKLLRAVAPWVAGVERDRPSARLFRRVTGCVAGLPDGRPGFVPQARRHAACPHPELCDPAIALEDGNARSEPG
jgi:hypothetical protein